MLFKRGGGGDCNISTARKEGSAFGFSFCQETLLIPNKLGNCPQEIQVSTCQAPPPPLPVLSLLTALKKRGLLLVRRGLPQKATASILVLTLQQPPPPSQHQPTPSPSNGPDCIPFSSLHCWTPLHSVDYTFSSGLQAIPIATEHFIES